MFFSRMDKNLLADENPERASVRERMKELHNSWSNLLKRSSEKGARLHQAAEQLKLNQLLEDEKLWLNDVETLLSSADVGDTLMDVKFLLRKQQVCGGTLWHYTDIFVSIIGHL